ncbi:hypothetical protein AAFF_G00005640 [Aldrovandia affinis]|uniref:Uncharacterized protein n=1 Tax=Aldrovandia affinis TaxID=143900 RepID=A0AAD7TDV2_9TELE|nr:hypothetical protein AAFF_G00005640 [Aldrovandia affinis]
MLVQLVDLTARAASTLMLASGSPHSVLLVTLQAPLQHWQWLQPGKGFGVKRCRDCRLSLHRCSCSQFWGGAETQIPRVFGITACARSLCCSAQRFISQEYNRQFRGEKPRSKTPITLQRGYRVSSLALMPNARKHDSANSAFNKRRGDGGNALRPDGRYVLRLRNSLSPSLFTRSEDRGARSTARRHVSSLAHNRCGNAAPSPCGTGIIKS